MKSAAVAARRFLRLDQFNVDLAQGKLVEEEINGGNPAIPSNDEIRTGDCWGLAWAARYPLDSPTITLFLGPGNYPISKVRGG